MIETIIEFAKDHIFNVIVILLAAYIVRRIAMMVLKKIVHRTITHNELHVSEHEEKQREDTLLSTIGAGIRVAVWVFTSLLLLAEIGIDIAPLLAGAGIAGVALGFGAQSMVKDFLAGIFIISENQYRVGDVIEINQTVSGSVQFLSLRKTVLRDLDGMVHHIPNGEITIATNMTMEYANVNLDIGVGYGTDIDKLEKIINTVGKAIHTDEKWSEFVLEPPKFLRLNDFADSSMEIKIVGRTAPMKQWAVTGELRRRLKKEFDKNGIEIPFPQRVVHNAPKSVKSKLN